MRRWMFLAAGALGGAFAAILFLAIHALLLRPIWFSLPRALATGAFAGAVVGYAYDSFISDRARRPSLRHGLAFGIVLWAALLPPTVAELLLKAVWPTVPDPIDVTMVLAALVLPTGALAWRRRRSYRSVIVAIAVVGTLFIATGGPLAPGQLRRGGPLIGGLLPIFAAAGACLTAILRALACSAGRLPERAA